MPSLFVITTASGNQYTIEKLTNSASKGLIWSSSECRPGVDSAGKLVGLLAGTKATVGEPLMFFTKKNSGPLSLRVTSPVVSIRKMT